MEMFECKDIGGGLYSVTIDGVTLAAPITQEEIGKLYAKIWNEAKERENEVQARTSS